MTLKRLIILRHAKSSSPDGTLDHERRLDELGKIQSRQAGEQLASLGWLPNKVLCSSAKRTQETLDFLLPFLAKPVVHSTSELYATSLSSMLNLIEKHSDVQTLMLVGHNPTVEELLQELCSEFTEMKPANAALLELENGSWTLKHLIRPHE